eukprot:TRINITY_DN13864_c0_g3_i1.p1 TRINITY_DN13864_c0_g3~~TRINITY_DN13864_c0_g3_i1.p1  ORF type:complete len:373 (+),score=84.35 TRINITY_DN13864_c0_g3_i1:51-1121(+)
MATAQDPIVKPFKYCFIPCEDGEPVTEKLFEGKDDKELRDGIAAYFSKEKLTVGQVEDFKEGMQEQIKQNQQKSLNQGASPQETDPTQQAALAQAMASQGGFEIVPVIFPDVTTEYKGVSLYIDQVGRFKNLPLNNRASKLSQRDIRGDAFVIASYDDPVQDDWARIDCPKETVDHIIQNPPQKSQDPTARAAAMQASMQTTLLSEENMCKARSLKEAGNEFAKTDRPEDAEIKYSEALKELQGRQDAVDQKECNSLILTLHSNRAQMNLKLKKYKEAVADCTAVLSSDSSNIKALFRRSQGYLQTSEFNAALADIDAALAIQPSDKQFANHKATIEASMAKQKKNEKAMYKKMFS